MNGTTTKTDSRPASGTKEDVVTHAYRTLFGEVEPGDHSLCRLVKWKKPPARLQPIPPSNACSLCLAISKASRP